MTHVATALSVMPAVWVDSVEKARDLFDANFDRLYRFFYLGLGGHAQAEELTAETFAEVLLTPPSPPCDRWSFEARLFRVAGRRLASLLRDLSATDTVAGHVRDEYLDPKIQAMLRPLPRDSRIALELRCLVGLSDQETAAVMGTAERAVRVLLLEAARSCAGQAQALEG